MSNDISFILLFGGLALFTICALGIICALESIAAKLEQLISIYSKKAQP